VSSTNGDTLAGRFENLVYDVVFENDLIRTLPENMKLLRHQDTLNEEEFQKVLDGESVVTGVTAYEMYVNGDVVRQVLIEMYKTCRIDADLLGLPMPKPIPQTLYRAIYEHFLVRRGRLPTVKELFLEDLIPDMIERGLLEG
jgi:hypothetical protein